MDTAEFKEVFAAEARDYLQSLNKDLLELERDPENRDILDEMFRAAHSLKGMAGTMGFTGLANFTHSMESVLDLLRTGELSATTQVVNGLFKSVDTLEVLLDQTLMDEELDDVTDIIEMLQGLMNDKSEVEKAPIEEDESREDILDEFSKETVNQGVKQGYNAFQIRITLRENTLLKSVRVYTVFQALEAVGTIIKCHPSAQDLEEERFDNEFSLVLMTNETQSSIEQLINGISEIEGINVNGLTDKDLAPSYSVATESSQSGSNETAAKSKPAETANGNGKNGKARGGQARFADKFVRVETDRLDKLINLVGELVISRTQVLEMAKTLGESESKGSIVQLDRVTTDLQYAAMKLRMVPIKEVFDRFPRMVRDLAQSRDKEVNLVVNGEETELDRTIVNQIGDPLVHLIRNSVDHGLETKEERKSADKPEYGTITLEARHEGSHVLIEVSDDGQGINVEKVRQKAIERGLLPADHSDKITMKEAINLLFEPGFSTADAVTDVSGRGVGMDAVKASVEALSGSVEMESTPGQGSKIIIKLPLTLAIIKALLVRTSGETFAIPIQAVRENLRVAPEDIKSLRQQQVIVIRNEVLPLVDLAENLGFERPEYEESLPVIVVESRGEKVGFIVEDLIGQQEIVIKSLSAILGEIPGIAGATVLGNGRVALILDNSTLIKQGA